MKDYVLKLSEQEVNKVFAALGEMQGKLVYDVMKKIEIQIHEQSKVVETPTPQVEEKIS